MEKIMILGAGAAQIPLIRAARAMGYEAVAASIPGPYPGLAEADTVSYTDIADPQAVADAAEALGVSAVATCCMETGLPALAYTCRRLALPGISPAAAECSVNKLSMKRAFAAHGVLSARFCELRSAAGLDGTIQALGLPLVVKAVDLQGSRGVTVAKTRQQALDALEESLRLTAMDYCIAEEFIPGENIGAEAFVQDGRVVFVLPDGTVSHRGSVNIPIGHYAPLDRPEPVLQRIRREVEKAIAACGLDNCAVNVDLVLRGDEPYIIELTARAGATCLPELVSIYYGIDYYRMILMAALGQDVLPLFAQRRPVPRANASAMLRAERDGVVRSVRLPEPLPENVYDLHLIVKPGDRVKKFSSTGDRIGQLIVEGDTAAACLRDIDSILARTVIEVE